jgi:hypothetical protein
MGFDTRKHKPTIKVRAISPFGPMEELEAMFLEGR